MDLPPPGSTIVGGSAPVAGTGRRARLRPVCPPGRGGSNPPWGTTRGSAPWPRGGAGIMARCLSVPGQSARRPGRTVTEEHSPSQAYGASLLMTLGATPRRFESCMLRDAAQSTDPASRATARAAQSPLGPSGRITWMVRLVRSMAPRWKRGGGNPTGVRIPHHPQCPASGPRTRAVRALGQQDRDLPNVDRLER